MSNANLAKLKNILLFAYDNTYSDFYKTKFDRAGFNPHTDFASLTDVERIPLTTKDELVAAGENKLLFVPIDEIISVASTSGTTGEPFVIRFSHNQPTHEALEEETTGPVLILNSPFIGGRMYGRYERVHTKGPPIFGDIHNLPASAKLAARMGATMITTTPTLAILFVKYVAQYPELMRSLKYLRLSSELLSPAKKEFLKELYPGVEIHMVYSSSEGERMGFQCKHLAARQETFYHLYLWKGTDETTQHMEIINPETGKDLAVGERGEFVLTTLYNHGTPLIRYRTGDLANFAPNDCPCGHPGLLLQTWGRAAFDVVRAAGFELKREMFEAPLMKLQVYLEPHFEVLAQEMFATGKPTLSLTLRLMLKEGSKESQALTKKIAEEFLKVRLSPTFTIEGAIAAGLVEPLRIEYASFAESHKARGRILLV